MFYISPQFFLIFGLTCAVIMVCGCVWWWISTRNTLFSDIDTVTIQFPHGNITAEISASILKHAAGLSGRVELAPSTGMLFVFSSPQKQSFWMKGMKFPLDFIWISQNVVTETRSQIQPPKNILDVTLITPSQPAEFVLEVPAGTIEKMGIKIGDVVSIKK